MTDPVHFVGADGRELRQLSFATGPITCLLAQKPMHDQASVRRGASPPLTRWIFRPSPCTACSAAGCISSLRSGNAADGASLGHGDLRTLSVPNKYHERSRTNQPQEREYETCLTLRPCPGWPCGSGWLESVRQRAGSPMAIERPAERCALTTPSSEPACPRGLRVEGDPRPVPAEHRAYCRCWIKHASRCAVARREQGAAAVIRKDSLTAGPDALPLQSLAPRTRPRVLHPAWPLVRSHR